MYQLIIAIVWYMAVQVLQDMHQQARKKTSRDDRIAGLTAYGVIIVTIVTVLMLMIGGAING